MMWIPPLCDKNCGVSINIHDLTLDQLMKINEYRDIRDTIEEFHLKEQEAKSANGR